MLSAIRTRLHITPATVIAILALVLASSGGAYAAGRYLITSTKQISPKVLKSLKGAAGAKGAAGPAGPAGPAGAGGTGPAGPQGPAGAAGGAGKEGPAGKEGKQGPPGTTGFTATLPKGSTETGAWTDQVSPGNTTASALSSISFAIPLASALDKEHVFFVEPESTAHEKECPGSVEHPLAEAGDLCVYAHIMAEVKPSFGVIHDPSSELNFSEHGAAATGAFLTFEPAGTEGGAAWGTWAVTAP
jgi:hypothetical protein